MASNVQDFRKNVRDIRENIDKMLHASNSMSKNVKNSEKCLIMANDVQDFKIMSSFWEKLAK